MVERHAVVSIRCAKIAGAILSLIPRGLCVGTLRCMSLAPEECCAKGVVLRVDVKVESRDSIAMKKRLTKLGGRGRFPIATSRSAGYRTM